MRPGVQRLRSQITLRHALLGFFLIFLLAAVSRSGFSSTGPDQGAPPLKAADPAPTATSPAASACDKIPPSLAAAVVHYATSNSTPQQTEEEISVTARVLGRRSPCNFLVFGLGRDSLMWAALNHGGRTVFLEEDRAWIDAVRRRLPALEAYHLVYRTKVRHADGLLRVGRGEDCTAVAGDPAASGCPLALRELPAAVVGREWDLIMVDAPTGYFDDAPGRMGAIYTAGMMARGRRSSGETDVFVHDVDRPVEDRFSRAFLCDGYLREQRGRLRHFAVPSHREQPGRPFCPGA